MTDEPVTDEPRVRVTFPSPLVGGAEVGNECDAPARAGRPLAGVALVTIDRPRVLNALDGATIDQLADAFEALDADPACRCIVLTGAGERAFAAGGDIREMAEESAAGLLASDRFARWERIARVRTPTIAAVRGFALGGGCELAMACDMIVAADDAVFGQPELRLGIIPGAGGTQRLTRALGKAKAMELILTGRNLPAVEAEAHGLVNRLVPADRVVPAALELAAEIAAMPPLAVEAAVEAVRAAQELPLRDGLALERRLFYLLFATEDQREGMRAFLDKRPATWQGR
ncbi:MAG TPA: enoyl-CoA hydratase-related protein [Candidatus Acidoferrales bacterium]|nr:enoyl-CoA hydratase-related protein [Candidatus Acidoferrales bacterium]